MTDSYIEGNTDFMWGSAAAYFQRCELKALDTGTSNVGFYTQIRNGITGFGNVYVDCKLTVADGVVGRSTYFLGRIDPNPGNFPYSQCIFLNCAMGPHIDPAGWRLDNATSSSTIQYWEYQSTDLSGAALDVSRRHPSSRQLSEREAALWRNPAFVLGGWVPQLGAAIDASPASQSAVAGSTVQFSALAAGSPQPVLQWFKDGVAIPGATDYTLVLPNVQPSSAGRYTVRAANVHGSAVSSAATLAVTRGRHAGAYFGALGGGATGTFALFVRDNGTGAFYAQSGSTALFARPISVDSSGRFQFTPQAAGAATAQVITNGVIDAATGAVTGSGGLTFSGTRANDGTTAAAAGYYLTGVNGGSATIALVVGGGGQAFAFVQNGAVTDAGSGSVGANGTVSVQTAGGIQISGTVANGAAALTATPSAGGALALAGVRDTERETLRLRQFSTRARIDATNPALAGFVLTGDAPTAVLVRAVGPTLGDAFAVAGALTNPRLDLYRGGTLIASNVGWTSALNPTEIALAGAQSGAFPLRGNVADSAVRLSLAPGAYTALLSSATGAVSGIGLLEIYDLSAGAAGQRLFNLSTRGSVGNGTNALLLGFVVGGSHPKRVLIRGVGPGLTAFGVTGAVARPVLTLYRGSTLVAQNNGWSTSADASGIMAAAGEVGTFALAANSADSAVLLSLAPGLYTAQLTSADGTTGTGLIELYEFP